MNAETRNLVRSRARHHCEYCMLHQDHEPLFRFHVEHIIAKQHGGRDALDNLALSCYHCNAHKGPNVAGVDPASGSLVPLFHPRQQSWFDHFRFEGAIIVGLT